METRAARFHNIYGPLGTFDGGREKAPAAICRKVIQAKLSGQHEIEIWRDGEQTRSFMYIDDCVEGIHLFTEGQNTEPLNLGSAEMVSINQLVDIVEDIADIKLKRNYKLDAPKGVRARSSDNTRIQEVYGWEPSTSLRDGMEKTYAWIYDEITSVVPEPGAFRMIIQPGENTGNRLIGNRGEVAKEGLAPFVLKSYSNHSETGAARGMLNAFQKNSGAATTHQMVSPIKALRRKKIDGAQPGNPTVWLCHQPATVFA